VALSLFDFLTPIGGPIFGGGPVDDCRGGILQTPKLAEGVADANSDKIVTNEIIIIMKDDGEGVREWL